jgi:hypothetical protein
MANLVAHSSGSALSKAIFDPAPRKCEDVLSCRQERSGDQDDLGQGLLNVDCTKCVVVDTEHDFHCENRENEDCGSPGNWFDDDDRWIRDVNIMQCQNNKQYRRCGPWRRDACCPFGTVGPPSPHCGKKNGRDACGPTPVEPGPDAR